MDLDVFHSRERWVETDLVEPLLQLEAAGVGGVEVALQLDEAAVEVGLAGAETRLAPAAPRRRLVQLLLQRRRPGAHLPALGRLRVQPLLQILAEKKRRSTRVSEREVVSYKLDASCIGVLAPGLNRLTLELVLDRFKVIN